MRDAELRPLDLRPNGQDWLPAGSPSSPGDAGMLTSISPLIGSKRSAGVTLTTLAYKHRNTEYRKHEVNTVH